ncbi:MAG: pyridoxine 5'-phosphate synthase [Kordiimonas sp.]|nr:pyridoxine 5'-phosphate synthase [Kordiimonas sp.]|tara:strand:+ start:978 stop:1703 length:726 start_codon:yes stop_codon:yes gene_type:complete
MLRLGVNIDHVATVRNARGGLHPDPVRAARLAKKAGAQGITAHLREDRRHIRDEDVFRLKAEVALPLNLEMAATEEMLCIALEVRPNACCLVPERREELTTEGGLNLLADETYLKTYVGKLSDAGIRVSLFIDPDEEQISAAARIGADIVELHTGRYCEALGAAHTDEIGRIARGAKHAAALGLEVHAGHGLDYATVGPIAAIPEIIELNIGHFLMGEAIFEGLDVAIRRMRSLMQRGRSG